MISCNTCGSEMYGSVEARSFLGIKSPATLTKYRNDGGIRSSYDKGYGYFYPLIDLENLKRELERRDKKIEIIMEVRSHGGSSDRNDSKDIPTERIQR